MPALVSIGDTEIMTAVRAVLLGILPSGVEVIRAYGNRVPEPLSPDFCVLTTLRRERLSTNVDADADLHLIGGIVNDTLTVTSGPILLPGYLLYGSVMVPGSVVTAVLEAPGSYTVAPPQMVAAGSRIYAGRHTMLQPMDVVYQCDVHGPNGDMNALAIQTTWRDERGCQLLAQASQPYGMTPLYAEDPRMVPFPNAESQWEDRWIVDLHTQVNLVVSLDQEFADQLKLGIYSVDVVTIPQVTPHTP
jgi:hypothetical protein